MMAAGYHNLDLTVYLVGQVLQSPQQRLDALKDFVPTARLEDWGAGARRAARAGDQKGSEAGRHPAIRHRSDCSGDGSISALLGASPGASTAVPIMLELIQNCFKTQVATPDWQAKLKKMIPSYGDSLIKNAPLHEKLMAWTSSVLGLKE